eukprot:CAMPEP_0198200994 /NCGR_PEP_ID=MMETSP1445-20131203/3843_1 /TAXON_ID=36898 /ORGANISM="Pyramimonas sp., Strain CCMP2087" /LENGTH=165 /DNA_ID=CAMNT_0043871169 /DNA_START=248 /DNA_END=742 /DNA_ORIENTATION=+
MMGLLQSSWLFISLLISTTAVEGRDANSTHHNHLSLHPCDDKETNSSINGCGPPLPRQSTADSDDLKMNMDGMKMDDDNMGGMDGMKTYFSFSDLHDYRLMFKFLDIDNERAYYAAVVGSFLFGAAVHFANKLAHMIEMAAIRRYRRQTVIMLSGGLLTVRSALH